MQVLLAEASKPSCPFVASPSVTPSSNESNGRLSLFLFPLFLPSALFSPGFSSPSVPSTDDLRAIRCNNRFKGPQAKAAGVGWRVGRGSHVIRGYHQF